MKMIGFVKNKSDICDCKGMFEYQIDGIIIYNIERAHYLVWLKEKI